MNPDYGNGFEMTRSLLKHASVVGTGDIPNQQNLIRHFASFDLIGGSVLYYSGWLGMIAYCALVLFNSFLMLNIIKRLLGANNYYKMAILLMSAYLLFKNILSLLSVFGLPFLTMEPAFAIGGDCILFMMICFVPELQKTQKSITYK